MSLKLMKQRWMSSDSVDVDSFVSTIQSGYRWIDDRVVVCDAALGKEPKPMRCSCTTSEEQREKGEEPCGSDCLNRLLFMECGSRCPCGDLCSNKRFQQRRYASVEAFDAGEKGWGLRTKEAVAKGSFLIEYIGELLDGREFERRRVRYARDTNHRHHYFMALRNGLVIDATMMGNVSRFLNHSCQPNAETQKWTVDRQLRIGFFAKRDIAAGEEICINYQFERYGRQAQKCLCGTSVCRGVIGADNDNDEDQSNEDNMEEEGDEDEKEEEEDIEERRRIDRKKEREREANIRLERKVNALTRQLSEPEQIPELLRLMLRVTTIPLREQLADVLLNRVNDQLLLRVFMEKGGLRLVWMWLVDNAHPLRPLFSLRSRLLSLLDILPIVNLNQLNEAHLIETVKRIQQSRLRDEDVVMDMMREMLDRVIGEGEDTVQSLSELHQHSIDLGNHLLVKWSSLRQAFRIPRCTTSSDQSTSKSFPLRENYINRPRAVLPQRATYLSRWSERRKAPYSIDKRYHQHRLPIANSRSNVPVPVKMTTMATSTRAVSAVVGVRRRPSRFDQRTPLGRGTASVMENGVCLVPEPMHLSSPSDSPVAQSKPSMTLPSFLLSTESTWMPNFDLPIEGGQSNSTLLDAIRLKISALEKQLSLLRNMETQMMMQRESGGEEAMESNAVPPPPPPANGLLGTTSLCSDWASATDVQGNVYYYNIVTRESRWDLPGEEEGVSSAGAAPDTTTVDQETRANFKLQMAKHVAALLSPYRKARFSSTAAFKHTLRKLTHTILDKELKRKSDDRPLEVTESVKDKAKKYVSDYMRRLADEKNKTL